ncbi:glycoside hydrolase family 105 protein [Formosa sp. PL04]|uniref:glycoside hydrolase family 88/105 protein n=1 Tax=Formosa sp. PL04 TaxID=3081755 RepID=UPI0029810A90|nr:glycoside hydrolase family 88 protein [Formosa sp. PL04]MDW5288113.1 glycoside hydrolase family 88 protein [Formosa sp. PL04]
MKIKFMAKHSIIGVFVMSVFALQASKLIAQNNQESSKDIESKMVKALEWQEAHPIYAYAPTDWTNGAYYAGVVKAHESTKNQIFLAALKNMGYVNEWKPFNRVHHADDIAISYAYLYVSTTRKNLVNLKPTEDFLQKHLQGSHAWKEHASKDKMEQTLWWWCDALFMAPPVITSYAKVTGDTSYLDEMYPYYKETYDLLYDQKEHLFARDSRFLWKGNTKDRKEKNGNKIFWSRGNGWVIGGLAMILEDMPKDYKHRAFYEKLFVEMAKSIKALQPEDGLWRTSLLSPESFNHGEVSGSGFFTYAMAWGINNGLLSKDEFQPAVLKAWNVLETCQKENGMVGWVQNIGYDPRPADADSWQNYGTGAFLLAGSEVLKLKTYQK